MIASSFLSWFPAKNFNWIYNWLGTGWHTENRYPLTSEKLALKWSDPESVVGVRFQSKTRYALLDIDVTSLYHPKNSIDNSIYNIESALESIGINQLIWLRSSNSGGLHAYIPLPELVPTFKLAQLLTQTLQTAGFNIKQGHLEIFPNPKSYSKFQPTNYNGHRLPLQPATGSCLLTHNQFGRFSESSTDINQWHLLMVEASKTHDFDLLLNKIKQVKIDRSICTQHYSSSAAKWRQDLEALVCKGWTASGQTNEILFNLLQLGVVFNNLEDQQLIQFMIQTAQTMPGYEQFCGHQHDISQRCSDWVKWNETHQKYKPYASQPDRKSPVRPPISSNHSRSIEAREKILRAVVELAGQIFKTSRQLLQAIIAKIKELFDVGCSLATLYKFRILWQHLLVPPIDEYIQTSPGFLESSSIPEVSLPSEKSVTSSGRGFCPSSDPPKIAQTTSPSTVTGNPPNEGFCTPSKNKPSGGGRRGGDKQFLMNLFERVKNRSLGIAPQISDDDHASQKDSDFPAGDFFHQSDPPPD